MIMIKLILSIHCIPNEITVTYICNVSLSETDGTYIKRYTVKLTRYQEGDMQRNLRTSHLRNSSITC
jgi:hypothetical protein